MAIAALAACAGCDVEGRREEAVATPPGFPFVEELRRPIARLVDSNVTYEAAQWNFRSLRTPDSVVAFYRRELVSKGFEINGEQRDGETFSLYARRGREAIWVHASPDPLGSRFVLVASLTAARLADSGQADTARHD